MSDLPVPQRSAFLGGEGDAWFSRNEAHLNAPSSIRDKVVNHLAAALRDGDSVLEIGCGNASHLAALAAKGRLNAAGIDPSAAAIAAGRAAQPALDLRVATADALPFDDHAFDLVLFGFCLYLVDRPLLWRCVAEADRVLKPRGWLAILDFDPDAPQRKPYHHHEGLWSWKADHSRLFLGHPAYRVAEKWSASHAGLGWHDDPHERIGFWLLRKDDAAAWPQPMETPA